MNNNFNRIITTYFGNKFSAKTQALFRKWFRLDANNDEKDAAMYELWQNAPSTITPETLEDLARLKEKIGFSCSDNPVVTHRKRIHYVAYAALVVCIVCSAVWIGYQNVKPAAYTQLVVARGESRTLTLTDGTVIVVNAASTLIYPENFDQSPSRTVFLTGEASFKVAHDPAKPFLVKTTSYTVQAIGTQFDIKAYGNDCISKTTLREGSVKVDLLNNPQQSYMLTPNQQFIYNTSTGETKIIQVEADKLAGWEKGYLIFLGESFADIIKTIELKYDVTIKYDSHRLNRKRTYYVKFRPEESLDSVMRVLSELVPKSSYTIDNKVIHFYTK